jgi:ABC-type transport system involved in multi-copper enzyme maturation permease subunit
MTNPIIQRELVTLLRTRKAVAVQALLAVALASLVALRWPTDARVDLDGSQARQVFSVFAYGLMVGLILLAPVFPATTIVKEKRQGTLTLLLNSPMTAAQIVGGKLAGVLGFVLLLIALSLPAAAACYAMGGIDLWNQLLRAYLVMACLAFQYSTLGLLVSSYAGTTESAARITYGLILMLAVVTLGPKQFLQGLEWMPPVGLVVVDWLSCLSPIRAMMEVVGHDAVGAAGLRGIEHVAMRFCALALISGAIFATWTWSRMNSRIFDQARDAGRITDEQSASTQAYRRLMYLWFFDPQRRSDLIGWRPLHVLGALVVAAVAAAAAVTWFTRVTLSGDLLQMLILVLVGTVPALLAVGAAAGAVWLIINGIPTAVKEQKTRRLGRGHWMARFFGACLIISLGLMLATTSGTIDWGVETLGGIVVLLQAALIVLITPSLASGLIAGEQESRGWQLLQMTRLSPLSIVAGKLLSVGWTLFMILMATLPAYAVLIYVKNEIAPTVLAVLGTMVLTAVFALLLSAAMSSVFRKTAAATTTAYAVLVSICAGTMLVWMAKDAPFTRQTVEAALMINPLAAALQLIGAPGFVDYNLVPANWWIIGGASGVCLLVLIVQTWRLSRPR